MSAQKRAIAERARIESRMNAELRARLVRIARACGADEEVAEDVAQNALIALWRKPEALEPGNRGLLVTIVKRQTQQELRRLTFRGRSLDPRNISLDVLEPGDEDEDDEDFMLFDYRRAHPRG